MILTGMLAWWDENPVELAACISSAKGLLDRIVAVDGAYRLTPAGRTTSPAGQRDAIMDAAADSAIDCRIYDAPHLWDGQVEKRDWMIKRACDWGGDFVMPVDADYRFRGNFPAVRTELAARSEDVFVVQFHTPHPAGFNLAQSPHSWHTNLAGKTIKHALIFRALQDMQVEKHHWWYSGVKDGKRVGMWGPNHLYPSAGWHELQADFTIDHVCFSRDQARLDRNRDYCIRRDAEVKATGVET